MGNLIVCGRSGDIEAPDDTERHIGRANNVVVSIRRKPKTITRWIVVMTPAEPGELTVNTSNISHLIRLMEKARAVAYSENRKIDASSVEPRLCEVAAPADVKQ
jgi:hypothetical protein